MLSVAGSKPFTATVDTYSAPLPDRPLTPRALPRSLTPIPAVIPALDSCKPTLNVGALLTPPPVTVTVAVPVSE